MKVNKKNIYNYFDPRDGNYLARYGYFLEKKLMVRERQLKIKMKTKSWRKVLMITGFNG